MWSDLRQPQPQERSQEACLIGQFPPWCNSCFNDPSTHGCVVDGTWDDKVTMPARGGRNEFHIFSTTPRGQFPIFYSGPRRQGGRSSVNQRVNSTPRVWGVDLWTCRDRKKYARSVDDPDTQPIAPYNRPIANLDTLILNTIVSNGTKLVKITLHI